jgi:hypothetical protein
MPVGLADGLTRADLVDLVRFLSELGKVGPYAVTNERLVRRWQVLADTPAARKALTEAGREAPPGDELTWNAAYSRVSGLLPTADIPVLQNAQGADSGFARFQIEVTTPGAVDLALPPSPQVARAWVDGKLLEGKVVDGKMEHTTVELTSGTHTVTLAIDPAAGDQVRAELHDVAGSKAQAQIVGGK